MDNINLRILDYYDVLDEIRLNGNISLFTNLTFGRPVINNDGLIVVFSRDYEMNKEITDTKENINIISDAVYEVSGQKYKVRCLYDDQCASKSKNDPMQKLEEIKEKFPDIVSFE